MKTGISGAFCTAVLTLTLAAAIPARAQEKVGIVTTVIGPVTVARASLPPEPLKFKDDVFVRDRVTTGEAAITRILLGGKVIVTARERSALTITEVPGLSTIDLTSGRIAVAVEKSLMKPGERVDIRTPNAVAGVRGTVLIVEAQPQASTVTVLRGLVHVTRLDPASGLPVGSFTAVGARQAVTVRNNVLPARAQTISSSRASELAQEFTPPIKAVTSVAVAAPAEELQEARELEKFETPGSGPEIEKVGRGGSVSLGRDKVATAPVPAAKPTLATTPVTATAPTLVSAPTTVVTGPAPVSIKTSSPNFGSSLPHTSAAKRLATTP